MDFRAWTIPASTIHRVNRELLTGVNGREFPVEPIATDLVDEILVEYGLRPLHDDAVNLGLNYFAPIVQVGTGAADKNGHTLGMRFEVAANGNLRVWAWIGGPHSVRVR